MVLWPRKTMGPWANHNSHFRSRTFKHLFNLIYNSYNLSPIILSVNQTSPQPSPIIARLGFWPPSAAVHGCWRWSPPQTAAWVPPKDMDFFCLRCRTRKRSWDFLIKQPASTIWLETCVYIYTYIYIAIDGEYGSLMFFIFLWKICRNISSEMVEMKMHRTCRGIDLQLRLPWVLPFHLSRKTEKLQTPARTTWSSIPCTAIQIYIIIIYYIIIYICICICVYIYISWFSRSIIQDHDLHGRVTRVSAISRSTKRAKRRSRAHSKRSWERWGKLTSCGATVVPWMGPGITLWLWHSQFAMVKITMAIDGLHIYGLPTVLKNGWIFHVLVITRW